MTYFLHLECHIITKKIQNKKTEHENFSVKIHNNQSTKHMIITHKKTHTNCKFSDVWTSYCVSIGSVGSSQPKNCNFFYQTNCNFEKQ